jgi:CDP-paratose synthetase
VGSELMSILITGASGYIGKEFVRSLSDVYNIVVLVRESSDIEQLKNFNCKIEKFVNFKDIDDVFEKNDISGVVHFASNVVVEHTKEDIDNILDSNIKYGTYLLEASKNCSVKWFINTGTFWQNFESKAYNPVNLYAASKEAFEDIARYYTQTSDLIFTTIKLNDTFGPNDVRSKIFNLWDTYSKSAETLDMSKGEQIIDISYIDDVINAFKIMIENLQDANSSKYNNKSYVVSSNERMSLKELAKLFENVTGRELNINWGGRPYREREVMLPLENCELVPKWKQKYTLKEAILKTIGEK